MTAVAAGATVLEARSLSRTFSIGASFWGARQKLRAVDDVSISLQRGRVTALVGESGSGKSTIARLLTRLHEPTTGSIVLEGEDVTRIHGRRRLRAYRAQVQMIFQDPFDSLNLVKRVGHHLARPLRIHRVVPGDQVDVRVLELLESVGLVPGKSSRPSTHTSCRVVRGSALRSRGRSPSSRRSCSQMSRSRCSTSRSGSAS